MLGVIENKLNLIDIYLFFCFEEKQFLLQVLSSLVYSFDPFLFKPYFLTWATEQYPSAPKIIPIIVLTIYGFLCK